MSKTPPIAFISIEQEQAISLADPGAGCLFIDPSLVRAASTSKRQEQLWYSVLAPGF